VILKEDKVAKPGSIWWTVLVSRVLPYVLCLALLTGGVYVLYSTLVSIFFKGVTIPVPRDVWGITCLLAGATVLSRMPRLDKILRKASSGRRFSWPAFLDIYSLYQVVRRNY
jgi:hypothetical protein